MNRSSNGFVLTVCISIIFFISSCESFFLSRVISTPGDFYEGDPLSVKVAKLSSPKTKLPYEYYFLYCSRQIHDISEHWNLQLGDRIQNSVYMSEDAKYFINNHLSFRVMYQKDPENNSARIVGFEVTPTSIKHEYKEWGEKNRQLTMCNQNSEKIIQGSTKPQEVATGEDVLFTYDVTFKSEEDDGWAD
ncbi:hypothetical protein L1887_19855 [Cichorium endivia]|nr:hypothetical protein L1887_19855 [Cichorium endivia]